MAQKPTAAPKDRQFHFTEKATNKKNFLSVIFSGTSRRRAPHLRYSRCGDKI